MKKKKKSSHKHKNNLNVSNKKLPIKEVSNIVEIPDNKDLLNKEVNNKDDIKDKKYNKLLIIISIVVFLIIICLYLFLPHFKLNGNKKIDIPVLSIYNDEGANAYSILPFKNIDVNVDNKVDTSKLGTYEIIYTIKGLINNKLKRIVNVVDTESPKLEVSSDDLILCPNEELKDSSVKASDNYDGDLTSNISIEEKDGFVNYDVSDSSGNKTSKQRKIIRQDVDKPLITLIGSDVYVRVGTNYNEQGYAARDNCDGDITSKVEVTNNIDINKAGTYSVNYKVKDSSNNEFSIERKVIVYNNTSGSGKTRTIYLTFDDGPSSTSTPRILDILKRRGVKATFFVVNKSDNLNYLIKREDAEGHVVALHSYSHNYSYVYSSVNNYMNDLKRIEDKVFNLIGKKSNVIRFPGGSSNTVSRNYSKGIMSYLTGYVTSKGYNYFDWNVGSGDAGGAFTKEQVYSNVISQLSPNRGNVVLMHDYENNDKTVNALDSIIDYGINNGYVFDVLTKDTYPVRHKISN